MRQRLGLADVLIKQPEVIILDEPTTGIDPKGVKELLSLIERLRHEQDITILFSSHNLHQVQEVCDRVCIFVEGRLLAEGKIEELSQQLFNEGSSLLELGIDNAEDLSVEDLRKILNKVQDVEQISTHKGHFLLSCSADVSSAVAQAIFDANYKLNFLVKKEYGLDAIYNRYFEGGLNHE